MAEKVAKDGIPPKFIWSVAALESGHGKSKAATESNNHFGIICTKKHDHSKCTWYKYHNCYLRHFESNEDGFRYFVALMKSKRYRTNQKLETVGEWANHIVSRGYTKSPTYAKCS